VVGRYVALLNHGALFCAFFEAACAASVFGRGSLLVRVLLVFPLGTLSPVRLLPARPHVLCSLFGVSAPLRWTEFVVERMLWFLRLHLMWPW
jgi:hypothetical protein